jgi:sigma-B regulation protein RsbU (phosphoserine phosphatase)
MNYSDIKSILVFNRDKNRVLSFLFELRKDNYLVNSASKIEEALTLINKNKTDLILLDIESLTSSEYSFYENLKNDQKFSSTPVILMVDKDIHSDLQSLAESKGDDVLRKPFELDDLKVRISTLLKRAEIFEMYSKSPTTTDKQEDKTKILLVDDDPQMIKLFKFSLERAGYECKSFNNANEALIGIKSYSPDLIISDIMMPEMDGFEFREKILNEHHLKNIPFLFLTAKGSEEDVLRGYDLEITDYVIKTAGPKVVLAKVNAIVNSLRKQKSKAISELHSAATSIVTKVIPDKAPEFNGYQINHWHQTFQGIPGGDLIDYFVADDNNLIIVLGDVMGKKWGAWHFALAYAGYIRSTVRAVIESSKDISPSKIISAVNKMIFKDVRVSEVFISLSLIHLDNNTNVIKYCGAGDNPIIILDSDNGFISKKKSEGLLLGFSDTSEYEDTLVELKLNDRILMFTDGLNESIDTNGIQFGTKKLEETLSKIYNEKDFIEKLKNELISFTSQNFEDDVTLITIKKTKGQL